MVKSWWIRVLFLAGLWGSAQAQVQTEWVNQPGGVAVALDAAGSVYTARWEYAPGGDIFLTKRTATGALLWEASSNNTDSNRHEVATWVGTDSRGNILVSGTVRSGYSNPVDVHGLLLKFNPQGKLLWRRDLGGPFDGSSTRKLLVDAQNNVWVLGLGAGANGLVTQVRKLTPDGSEVWTYSDTAGIGMPMNVKWTPDQALLIIGRSRYGILNGFTKIDAQGQPLWSQVGLSSTPQGDAAGDLAGNTYLVNDGTELRKLSATGATTWTRQHAMTALRVEVGSDGRPVLSGFPAGGGAGAAFMKYSGDGRVLWNQPDGDGPGVNSLLHAQMLLDRDNNAYLAASTLFEMAVTKVRADGSPAWVALAPGSSAVALAFGQDLSVHAVGGQTAKFSQALADLSLTLTASPDPAHVGLPLQVLWTVANQGPIASQGVSLRATLPTGATLAGVTASQGDCSVSLGELQCTLGELLAAGQAQVSVTLLPQARGKLQHQASVLASTEDPTPANNQAAGKTRVKP
jgi:hypothetical protein